MERGGCPRRAREGWINSPGGRQSPAAFLSLEGRGDVINTFIGRRAGSGGVLPDSLSEVG
jgi:hypothetical protein